MRRVLILLLFLQVVLAFSGSADAETVSDANDFVQTPVNQNGNNDYWLQSCPLAVVVKINSHRLIDITPPTKSPEDALWLLEAAEKHHLRDFVSVKSTNPERSRLACMVNRILLLRQASGTYHYDLRNLMAWFSVVVPDLVIHSNLDESLNEFVDDGILEFVREQAIRESQKSILQKAGDGISSAAVIYGIPVVYAIAKVVQYIGANIISAINNAVTPAFLDPVLRPIKERMGANIHRRLQPASSWLERKLSKTALDNSTQKIIAGLALRGLVLTRKEAASFNHNFREMAHQVQMAQKNMPESEQSARTSIAERMMGRPLTAATGALGLITAVIAGKDAMRTKFKGLKLEILEAVTEGRISQEAGEEKVKSLSNASWTLINLTDDEATQIFAVPPENTDNPLLFPLAEILPFEQQISRQTSIMESAVADLYSDEAPKRYLTAQVGEFASLARLVPVAMKLAVTTLAFEAILSAAYNEQLVIENPNELPEGARLLYNALIEQVPLKQLNYMLKESLGQWLNQIKLIAEKAKVDNAPSTKPENPKIKPIKRWFSPGTWRQLTAPIARPAIPAPVKERSDRKDPVMFLPRQEVRCVGIFS